MRTILLVALLAPFAAQAQGGAISPLRLVPAGDSVLVYVLEVPVTGGFVVYRRAGGAGGATVLPFERRTPVPVAAASDPAVLAGRLGPDLPIALRAEKAADPDELLRRLRGDRFGEAVLSMVSRRAALALGRLYADGEAQPGADYDYRVAFTDADGKETGKALTGHVRVADQVPAAPTALKASGGGSDRQARVTWTYPTYQGAASDFTVGFHVYRAEGNGPLRRLTATPVLRNDAQGPGEVYVDRDVTAGSYTYQVSAVDLAGRESALTAPVTVRLADHTPPAIPVDLAVRNGNGVVAVTWRMSPELDAAGYHIERSTSLTRAYTRLDRALIPVARPIWTDTVAGGHPYFYRVIAVDSAGNVSGPSNPVSALPRDTIPPPAPTGLALTTAQHRITARWAPVSARDLRGYYVYEVTGKDRTRVTDRPLTAAQFVDSGPAQGRGLTPGATYTIRVTALDSTFNESPGVEGRILVPDDQPPAPPSAFSARNVEGRFVELSWSASASQDVGGYLLTRSGGGPADTGARAVHRFAVTDRLWRDTAVTHGRRYGYRLTAIDRAGNVSAPRVDSVLFKALTPPPAPRAAGARALARGVEVRWERVVSLELAGYDVYRATLPTGTYQRLTRTPVSLLVFTDSTGHAGLYYTVRAVDRSGNESMPSPVAPVTSR